ncbi:MAG: PIN domain-containing protein [Micrococcales bacterium]|nr:PIN domain-containing protein [Micrococcales bacterium]
MTTVGERHNVGLGDPLDAAPAIRYGLLDTSVLVAEENAWPLMTERFPEYLYVSPITLAELEARILSAPDPETRAVRQSTLDMVSGMTVLEINEQVASCWSSLLVQLASVGRRVDSNHLWTAAIAYAYGVGLITTDTDLHALDDLDGPIIIDV